ncbi:MAG: phytanoyl-CoA dioxygenase family protein [Planctomycetota bacterium]
MKDLLRVAKRRAWEFQSLAANSGRHMLLHGGMVPDSVEIRERARQVRDQGYTLFDNFLSPQDFARLKAYFESTVSDLDLLDYPLEDLTRRQTMDDVQNTREIKKGEYHTLDELMKSAQLRKLQVRPYKVKPDWELLRVLALHPTLLGIACRALGSIPVLYNVLHLRSLPTRMGFESNAYHRDQEDPRYMLKFFLYLNDVGIENGPHCYFPGTHNRVYPWQNRSTRFTDEEMRRELGADRERVFTGKAGTLIVEDTRGYHKGLPLVKGVRDMIMVAFIGRYRPWKLTDDPSIRSFDWNPLERMVLDL